MSSLHFLCSLICMCVRVLFVIRSWIELLFGGGGLIKNWNVMQQKELKKHMHNYFKAFLIKYARKWKTLELSCRLFIHSLLFIHKSLMFFCFCVCDASRCDFEFILRQTKNSFSTWMELHRIRAPQIILMAWKNYWNYYHTE